MRRLSTALKIAIPVIALGIGLYAWWASFERRLSEADALQIAAAMVSEKKIDLSRYGPPQVSSNIPDERWIWTVYYPGKSRVLADFFVITIDDATGKAELSGGA